MPAANKKLNPVSLYAEARVLYPDTESSLKTIRQLILPLADSLELFKSGAITRFSVSGAFVGHIKVPRDSILERLNKEYFASRLARFQETYAEKIKGAPFGIVFTLQPDVYAKQQRWHIHLEGIGYREPETDVLWTMEDP